MACNSKLTMTHYIRKILLGMNLDTFTTNLVNMAKEPVFIYQGNAFSASLVKLERDKVYGWSEIKYKDPDGNICNFTTLLDDGKTMVGTGSIAFKSVDKEGNEIDRSALVARYEDGAPATMYKSVFETETILDDTKTLTDFMDLDVKSVYQLQLNPTSSEIIDILKEKKVLYFHFNYRAGYDQDDAFLIAQGELVFAVIGKLTTFEYSILEIPSTFDDNTDEVADDLDFNMF